MIKAVFQDHVAVTGGAGFVGSHLCDRLIARGNRVLALDDFSTGDPLNVLQLGAHPRFTLRHCDVVESLSPRIQAASKIFNLARPTHPACCQGQSVSSGMSRRIGTWRVLELARRTGARVLHVCGGGAADGRSARRSSGPNCPAADTISRRAHDDGEFGAEALCQHYAQERQAEVRLARLSDVYGPRLSPGDGRVVSNFIVQALRGEPVMVAGNGLHTRGFCYVDDSVEALLRLMDSDVDQPVCIGDPEPHALMEVAEMVLRLTGGPSRIVCDARAQQPPPCDRPDIDMARRALGWQPRVSLEDGLRETIAYFRCGLQMTGAPLHLAEHASSWSEHG